MNVDVDVNVYALISKEPNLLLNFKATYTHTHLSFIFSLSLTCILLVSLSLSSFLFQLFSYLLFNYFSYTFVCISLTTLSLFFSVYLTIYLFFLPFCISQFFLASTKIPIKAFAYYRTYTKQLEISLNSERNNYF
jgi:hypothetical protein